MRLLVALPALLLGSAHLAAAQPPAKAKAAAAPPAAPAAPAAAPAPPAPPRPAPGDPPPALVVVDHIAKGDNTVDVGTVDFTTKRFTARFAGLPIGQYKIATHPATGRWALSASPVAGNALPAFAAGKTPAPAPAEGVVTLVLGQGDDVVAVVAGDATCISGPCFEAPGFFTPDGDRLVVVYDTSKGRYYRTCSFEAAPVCSVWLDRRKARLPVPEAFTADVSRGAYERPGKGLFVETLPALPADPRVKPKPPAAAKTAVARPALLMGAPLLLVGDQLVYFRREPKQQKEGFIEAYDLKQKTTRLVHRLGAEFPMWFEGFHHAPASAEGTVVFLDNLGANIPSPMITFALATAAPARVLATDVYAVWDLTADGRWALFSRFTDPTRGDLADNPQQLGVLDVATGRIFALVTTGVPGARIAGARFSR